MLRVSVDCRFKSLGETCCQALSYLKEKKKELLLTTKYFQVTEKAVCMFVCMCEKKGFHHFRKSQKIVSGITAHLSLG